jgi:hypothetical protein
MYFGKILVKLIHVLIFNETLYRFNTFRDFKERYVIFYRLREIGR